MEKKKIIEKENSIKKKKNTAIALMFIGLFFFGFILETISISLFFKVLGQQKNPVDKKATKKWIIAAAFLLGFTGSTSAVSTEYDILVGIGTGFFISIVMYFIVKNKN